MTTITTLFTLAVVAFLAATVLPLQSEAVLTALLVAGQESWLSLLVVASLANTAGSVVNWYMGRWIVRYRNHRWFPASESQLTRAEEFYHRWGKWSLLGAWLPVLGDGLTVIAGVLQEKLWIFIALVGIGKAARYAALAAAVAGIW